MTYFIWTDDMNVGNSLLDHEHHTLADLVNELHTATARGEGREVIGEILEKLLAYTREHFRREEHHMEQVCYCELAAHKRQHLALLEQVQKLREKFDAGHVTVAAQVSALLRDWLSTHILREDKKFAAKLRQKTSHAPNSVSPT